ncbi:MAG: EAL domain-containing protein [Ketobacteraceae bacterium]|nr:EAL domain-containing protein [Ketobacteraceae bacterium]
MIGIQRLRPPELWLISTLILLALYAVPGRASTPAAPALSDETPEVTLTRTLKLYEAPVNLDSLEEHQIRKIIREATRRDVYNISRSDTDYWFLGSFRTGKNLSSREAVIVLDHPYPLYDNLRLIINPLSDNTLILENGNAYSYQNRPIKTRLMAFELPVEPDTEYRFLLKVHSLAKQPLSLSVQTTKHFLSRTVQVEFLWGLFFGLFFIAALYNLLIFVATQERVYLYYTLFILSTGLAQAGLTSHGMVYLWNFASEWNEGTNLLFVGCAGVFGILFTQHFLKTATYCPQIHKLLSITFIPCGVIIGASQILRYDIATTITDLVLAWLMILMISAGVVSYKAGEKTARFFLLGWGSLLGCMMIYILMMRGFIPVNDFTLFAPQIGSMLEISIINIAIGDRIRQDRRDKIDALNLQRATIGKLKGAEEALTQQALHDLTTGLANQNMLAMAIERALVNVDSNEMYLVLVKIKDLREINNTLGRYVGDQVAKFVASNLQTLLEDMPQQFQYALNEDNEKLAVTQGVTYAFLIRAPNNDSAINLVTNTLNHLPKYFSLESITLEIETYAGLCSASQANNSDELWLRNAFVAIEQAIKFSQACQLYDEAFNPYSERRLALINDLKKAVEEETLQVYLQPQLDGKSKTIVGAEALLRWNHPHHGFVPPDEFIGIAEDSGVIRSLTRLVVKKSLQALSELHQRGYMISLSINVSPQNLEEKDLTPYIVESLNAFNINPRYLTFELTETAMLINPELASSVLHEWNEMGLATAIDDFGTGYSSLSHLKRLPMKELKIDRSFVKDMLSNEDDHHIVQATLTIGHSLGMRVVAEGVEDEPLLSKLTEMGCDLIQGYYLTAPLPLENFIEWLRNTDYAVGHPKVRAIGTKQPRQVTRKPQR